MLKTIKASLSLSMFCVLICCLHAYGSTVTAASCGASDVQTAINSAHSGDAVVVPAGNCTWSSQVSIPNTKGIILNGSGSVTITNANISLNSNGSTPTEITGFKFVGSYSLSTAPAITASGCGGLATCGGTVTALYQIDNNTFTDTTDQAIFITVAGNGTGLINNNTFTGGAASEMIHNIGMGPSDASGWSDNVLPGAANMVYIETNTFTFNATGNPAYFYGTSAVQSYYGSRTVFRYNTLNNAQVDQHGNCAQIGARWWEVYQNTFNVAVNGNQSNYMAIRDGSGVVFNNHVSDPQNNGGAGVVELTNDCTSGTYPLPDQIGRGISQAYSPSYVWGNDASMSIVAGSQFVLANRDYFVSASEPSSMLRQELTTDNSSTTYQYVPYTYPYPVSGPPAPAPPSNLTANPQ
jgi:hypothetical protein